MSQFAVYVPTDEAYLESVVRHAEPIIQRIERVFPTLPCPRCRIPVPRRCFGSRRLFDYGDERLGRPVQIHLRFSRHLCPQCKKYITPDTTDIAPPCSRYTHRVILHALRLVIEDNLPYRPASWNLWRDQAVFVPFATIQNWVEAAGKKSGSLHPTACVSG
jgi:hypothetical protein